ncbi:nucleoside hydrolase [Actinokineospora auranticolor]|uniref:Inosine-uridine preferring nucleoside hydrolase n=1 Tax=Actinokineospora auranticolor TaxID=155976 RepID=A0A2S6GRK0_9PSEU|nr:nucleoside hydrolase [Actinokineospora auranticolor]PPK67854.1 inosine-uridine preferring nucleoside hydrolase [Actinokineospora auranticolor]
MKHSDYDDEFGINETIRATKDRSDRFNLGYEPKAYFPPSRRDTPMIIDTDAGGDPDDAIALIAAAAEPTLALVLTCDELGGERARFVRRLLDLLGRPDVPVVTGSDLGNTRLNCIDGLTPPHVPHQPDDIRAAVAKVLDSTTGPVRWVGIGPASNLAALLTERPDLAERLAVFQVGGALRYRDPERADHNFRTDIPAATALLGLVRLPYLQLSETTFTPEVEIAKDSPLHRLLADPTGPEWARFVAAHMDQWYAKFHHATMQHDALALSSAMELPFAGYYRAQIAIDERARTTVVPDGIHVRLTGVTHHEPFMRWLTEQIETAIAAGTGPAAQA